MGADPLNIPHPMGDSDVRRNTHSGVHVIGDTVHHLNWTGQALGFL